MFLQVFPMKGVIRLGKKDKYSPKYVGPYQNLHRMGQVDYKLELPQELEVVHPVFHVFMLRNCLGDPSCITLIEDVIITEDLSYEEVPVAILDCQVYKLQTKEVALVKVHSRNNSVEEMTWAAK